MHVGVCVAYVQWLSCRVVVECVAVWSDLSVVTQPWSVQCSCVRVCVSAWVASCTLRRGPSFLQVAPIGQDGTYLTSH